MMKKMLCAAIMIMLALSLVACSGGVGDDDERAIPNSDPDKATEALEDAGYTVMNMTKDGVGILAAYKKDDMDVAITIMYCADDEVDEAYEEAKAEWDEIKNEEEYKDCDFGKSGNMIYMGHKDAIKAAR